jgi:uncharacterized repeat protein (TIGR01451 family)
MCKKLLRSLIWILSGALLCFHPTLAAEPPPPRPHHEELESLPRMASDVPQESHADSMATDVASWSKLVFQSLRDGNWDIHIVNGDGSNQTRLTWNSAVDAYPRLNRGCTRIAFASNRTGNYEIFVMNADGSGVTQLTYDGANDYNPYWSPDGKQIAFSSYRDGQSEIYTMNADGSGLTRLTWDAGWDGEPAWSPDGSKIAFTAYRNSAYRIWRMNVDGSGQVQLSNQSYSENPNWSPDGSQIAYDTANGYGWFTVWVMNADGSNQHEVYYPQGYQTDDWVRSWSPDGRYLAFTRISYVYYQNRWYWTTAYLAAWDSMTNNFFYLSSQDTDWYPGWQTVDAAPPKSSITPLPAYTRNGATITWIGSDYGGSDIATYDVQVRDRAGGDWIDWQMGTVATSAAFTSTAGHTYDLRSRATDLAWNTEAWPLRNGDASTTLYLWSIAGVVRDNAGTPLAGALPVITPQAMYDTVSDSEGRYAAYVAAEAASYTATWSKTGYGNLPDTTLDARQDALQDVVMPPADNVVVNWGFEENAQPGPSWQAGGTLPVSITTAERHTGSRAVEMGQICTYTCLTEPLPLYGGENLDWAADSTGNLHMVWADALGIMYSMHSSSDSVWEDPTLIIPIAHQCSLLHLAIDARNVLHMIWGEWNESNAFYYSRRELSGDWTTPATIISVGSFTFPSDFAIDSRGGFHLIYQDDDGILYLERLPSGEWQTPLKLSTEAGTYGPGLAVGPDDTVHVVWQETFAGIYYKARRPDGTWTARTQLSSGYSINKQQITVDPDGRPHVFWVLAHSGHYTTLDENGNWLPAVELPKAYGNAGLTFDKWGMLYVVSNNPDGTYFRQKSPDTGWTEPIQLISDIGMNTPAVIVDSLGIFHTLWQYQGVPQYQTTVRAQEMSTATLSQSLTIPIGMQSPVLSLFYNQRMWPPIGESGFRVSLSDGVTTTLLLSATGASPWVSTYADVQPWVGKQVTITLGLHQAIGDPYVGVFLDEVTLGSAYPDLWVSKNSLPTAALPGEPVRFTLTYGNRGGVPADSVRITDTLPRELFFVDASPPPLTSTMVLPWLTWDIGDLPAQSEPVYIVITATVAPTATLWSTLTNTVSTETASPELETANNTTQVTIFVGRRAYLPMVMRSYSE